MVSQVDGLLNYGIFVISEMSPGSSHGPARSRDRNERGETTLHFAAIKGDQETVKKLLESGISPDVTDFAGKFDGKTIPVAQGISRIVYARVTG